jgi:hypothetical protein
MTRGRRAGAFSVSFQQIQNVLFLKGAGDDYRSRPKQMGNMLQRITAVKVGSFNMIKDYSGLYEPNRVFDLPDIVLNRRSQKSAGFKHLRQGGGAVDQHNLCPL